MCGGDLITPYCVTQDITLKQYQTVCSVTFKNYVNPSLIVFLKLKFTCLFAMLWC